MALFKRGKCWYYDFWFEGVRYQKSTKQRDKREAGKVEDSVRSDLARRKFNLPSKSLRFRELLRQVCGSRKNQPQTCLRGGAIPRLQASCAALR